MVCQTIPLAQLTHAVDITSHALLTDSLTPTRPKLSRLTLLTTAQDSIHTQHSRADNQQQALQHASNTQPDLRPCVGENAREPKCELANPRYVGVTLTRAQWSLSTESE